MKKLLTALLTSTAIALAPTPGNADVASDLQNFWENSGGGVNVSQPAFYQGQRAGFASLGSVSIKTRTRNTNLVNIQLPSVRAGCGGIDVFGGSFSFISREELIKLMEAIMQNASGFAFELALQSMSPAVQETVGKLRDLVQEVNAMSINSCETGQLLAGALWPKIDNASRHICKTIGAYQGRFADHVAGRHGCDTKGEQTTTLANANAEMADQVPVDINYAWRAIKKNNFLSADPNLAEYFMTLTGTIVTVAGANDSEGPTHNTYAPKAISGDMVDVLVDGGTASIYRCNGGTSGDCLDINTSGTITITADRSLRYYTSETIMAMYDAIRNNSGTEMPPHAVELLNMTTIPVYDLLQTGMATQYRFVQSEIDAMAEIIAVDLAMRYVDEAVSEMAKSAARISTFGNITFEYQEQIRNTQNAFAERRSLAAQRFETALSTLHRLSLARKEMAAVMAQRFANATDGGQ